VVALYGNRGLSVFSSAGEIGPAVVAGLVTDRVGVGYEGSPSSIGNRPV